MSRPASVSIYNMYMGGVDKADMYLALYRTKCRTRKWYTRFFTHFVNQSLINSWLLYVHAFGGTKSLVEFMLPLCFSLLAGGNINESSDEEQCETPEAKGGQRPHSLKTNQIPEEVRYDRHNHCPRKFEDQQRCKFTGCGHRTRFKCAKCCVYLCVVGSACFTLFHGVSL